MNNQEKKKEIYHYYFQTYDNQIKATEIRQCGNCEVILFNIIM